MSRVAAVDVRGQSVVELHVAELLTGRVRDFGLVEYSGDPTVQVETSDNGRLRRR